MPPLLDKVADGMDGLIALKARLVIFTFAVSINSCMLGNFSHFFLSSAGFLQKNYFWNTSIVSNSLDPDHHRYFVAPELGPNCLQRLSADKLPQSGKELKIFITLENVLFYAKLPNATLQKYGNGRKTKTNKKQGIEKQ